MSTKNDCDFYGHNEMTVTNVFGNIYNIFKINPLAFLILLSCFFPPKQWLPGYILYILLIYLKSVSLLLEYKLNEGKKSLVHRLWTKPPWKR